MGFEQNECKTYDSTNRNAKHPDKHFIASAAIENSLNPGTEEKSFTCDLCDDLPFSHSYELKRHKKTVHKGMRTHLCKLCGKSFAKAPIRDRHMVVHTGDRPFACHLCNKTFAQMFNLNSHKQHHHQIAISYTCEVCSKSFAKNFELRRHSKTHYKPEVSYTCEICNKRFTYPSGLKSHLLSHSTEKPFPCSLCKRAYSTMRNLCEHRKSAHPEACS